MAPVVHEWCTSGAKIMKDLSPAVTRASTLFQPAARNAWNPETALCAVLFALL